ncbi:MAG: hypothetical protein FWF08_01635 [Oscillospiraceae bacterium]|nr:hypothetical protein [Oscillospiraceae bacterium]
MKKHLILSTILILFSISTIFIMPSASFEADGTQRILAFALAFAFWAFLISGLVFFTLSVKRMKKNKTAAIPFVQEDGLPFILPWEQ